MIRIGVADYGLNVWDGGLYDIADRLQMLRALGYQGTERLEAVSEADALHKAACYRRCGMDFATCRGPSVAAGLEWTAALGKDYVWLTNGDCSRDVAMEVWQRRANEFGRIAREWGLRSALHNHLGQRIQNQDEVEAFLAGCPACDLVLDVGHLFGAGGDPAEIIRRYPERLAAIHVKDIKLLRPEVGLERWEERLDFCALGTGNAGFDLAAVFAALREVGYSGWIHVEQDRHETDPAAELRQSMNFIREQVQP